MQDLWLSKEQAKKVYGSEQGNKGTSKTKMKELLSLHNTLLLGFLSILVEARGHSVF